MSFPQHGFDVVYWKSVVSGKVLAVTSLGFSPMPMAMIISLLTQISDGYGMAVDKNSNVVVDCHRKILSSA